MNERSLEGVGGLAPAQRMVRIGIYACILGEPVRFDGGHKLDRFIRDTLGPLVQFVPVCPEVALGLGVPRDTLRLVQSARGVRLVTSRSGVDHTDGMREVSARLLAELQRADVSGLIVKKDSPSCGMERVRIYGRDGAPPRRDGRGLFADAAMQAMPLLPVEEEGRLNDPHLRDNFFERVFAYRRLRILFAQRWSPADLVAFHSREKLALLAHHRPDYQRLGRMVADAGRAPATQLAEQYQHRYMGGMRVLATRPKHANVLQHMAGYLRGVLDRADREELQQVIEQYRAGLVPLVVPLTLFRHHLRRHEVPYLAQQSYLDPHPKELMLRNHV